MSLPDVTSIVSAVIGQDASSFDEFIRYNASICPERDTFEKQFAKGTDRLKSWLILSKLSRVWNPYTCQDSYYEPFFDNLDEKTKNFCLAVLIIVFQIFGDGNHRTAYLFYEKKLGYPISDELIERIKHFHSQYDFFNLKCDADFIYKIIQLI